MSNDQGALSKFEDRKKKLFQCLDTAENCIKGTVLEQVETNYKLIHVKSKDSEKKLNISKFRGKESIFKRPEAPLTKCLKPRHVPDFQKNPKKWKKYTLDDVDISDRTNTSAALSFLKEIEERKQFEGMEEEKDNHEEKIKFKPFNKSKLKFNNSVKLSAILTDERNDDDKPLLKGSKVVMPEYVIGQKIKKTKKKINTKVINKDSLSSGLKLDHLLEIEDE